MNKRIVVLVSTIAGMLTHPITAGAEDAAPRTADALYATVNDKTITLGEFHGAFNTYLRQKYYHGQVPADQLQLARKEVGEQLVDRILLLEEAKRRGLLADEARIKQSIADYETRYAASPMWQKNREAMLPGLKQQLAEQDLLRQIEVIGKAVPDPSDEALREFHKTRIELFTEPEKLRLHTILLKVDPSAPKALWDAAREEATRIVARLRAGGAKFEELATLHSHDRSAEKGGDMGYLHRGMIPEAVQNQVEKRPLGAVGDPIDVLEGVAIFRLDERVPPKVMAFEDVAARARELLKREQSNQAWDGFVAHLRKTAAIKMHEPALPAPSAAKN